jgi:ketosteroid isomerase-like protein
MSRENVEIIRRMLSEVQRRPDALYEILHEDVEWETDDLGILSPESGRGAETVKAFFRSWVGTFEDWGFEVEDLTEADDAVVVRIHQWGQGRSSGVEVDQRFWQVWMMRDGKVIRATNHMDQQEALKAAGVPE